MRDFDEIKNIWQEQQDPKLNHEEILKRVKRSKSRLANKLLAEVLLMSVTIAVLSYAWYMIPFRMWTTHLSLLIFMASSLFVLFAQLTDYRRINSSSDLLDKPESYIQYLKKYQQERHQLNTQKYRVYTLFLGLGLLLFFVEIFFVASAWFTILGLGLSIAWIICCYFWLMRRYIRREENYLNEMIEDLERLQKQFGEE
ncbi:MAG: hypothetical protein ACKOW2_06190 [Sphingobacteriaceae bacterium]